MDSILPLFSASLIFWTHKVMQSCPMKYVHALAVPGSHPDVLPINNPPSLTPCSHGLVALVSSSPSLLLWCHYFRFPPLSRFSLPPPIPHGQALSTHFSSPSHSLALSPRWNSAVSRQRCGTGSNGRKRVRKENKARHRKQARGREAEQGRDSSSVFFFFKGHN